MIFTTKIHLHPMSKVRVRVISQEGHCSAGQRVGDEAVFDWDTHEIDGKVCLHALYEQVNESDPSQAEQEEEKVLRVIQKHGGMTPAEVARYVRGLSSAEARLLLEGLVQAGVLAQKRTSRTTYYDLPKEEPETNRQGDT